MHYELNTYSYLFQVLFLDADAVVPDLTTVTVSDDANETESAETESASPEEF